MSLNDTILEYMKNDKIAAHFLQYRRGVGPLLPSFVIISFISRLGQNHMKVRLTSG